MQTVQFQCGGCGKLMAVGAENLGRQVRCPHCQVVVTAPSAAVAAPPAPVPLPTNPALFGSAPQPETPALSPPQQDLEADSIFAPPPESDDLFGAVAAPRLELPPSFTPPAPMPAAPAVAEPGAINPAPDGNGMAPAPASEPAFMAAGAGNPFAGPFSSPAGDEVTAQVPGLAQHPSEATTPWLSPTEAEVPAAPPSDGSPFAAPAGVAQGEPDLAAPSPRPARQTQSGGGGWFIMYVFVPLVSYAILATIAVIILFNRLQQRPPDPREFLPDLDGDSPGKKPISMSFKYDDRLVNSPLPDHLRTNLGQTIRIGDLEFTPTKVERRTVRIFVEGRRKPEPLLEPSLVLHLTLRNMAKDYAFVPLDNYFDRHFSQGLQPPLTRLEIGPRTPVYGAAHWFPRKRGVKDTNFREWIEGRKNYDDKGLMPGEKVESLVCTEGLRPATAKLLADYNGPLFWRVHVRRGVVYYNGKEKTATAVIGVDFAAKDIVEGPVEQDT